VALQLSIFASALTVVMSLENKLPKIIIAQMVDVQFVSSQ
jgi:hypothetical protein